jgi:hypothetical protein
LGYPKMQMMPAIRNVFWRFVQLRIAVQVPAVVKAAFRKDFFSRRHTWYWTTVVAPKPRCVSRSLCFSIIKFHSCDSM